MITIHDSVYVKTSHFTIPNRTLRAPLDPASAASSLSRVRSTETHCEAARNLMTPGIPDKPSGSFSSKDRTGSHQRRQAKAGRSESLGVRPREDMKPPG